MAYVNYAMYALTDELVVAVCMSLWLSVSKHPVKNQVP